ncbi:Exocyst complex component 3-like protein [Liparis tanakae]|uniref:Exocyst complex component 3-like protein n=1 Tax=Liparis tanakae TaxID=230148 RepID=A0A4Z2F480_9TELE|nr:Exocyst complex component 3-like protein [Liparis tanakae]
MKKRVVCRSAEERRQLGQQMVQDDQRFREVLHGPVSALAARFPDIGEEHVSVLLDIRGDVSRDVRGAVLDSLERSAAPLPAGYRPIFTGIPVAPSAMAFCLPAAKCGTA